MRRADRRHHALSQPREQSLRCAAIKMPPSCVGLPVPLTIPAKSAGCSPQRRSTTENRAWPRHRSAGSACRRCTTGCCVSNDAGPAGLLTGKAPGPQPRLVDHHRAALRQVVEDGPIPAVHRVVRWRIADLLHWLWNEFRLSVSKQTLSRELRSLGFRRLSARPRYHARDLEAAGAFKKLPHLGSADRRHEAAGNLIEVW